MVVFKVGGIRTPNVMTDDRNVMDRTAFGDGGVTGVFFLLIVS